MKQLLLFLGLLLASVHAGAELPTAVARALKKENIPQRDVAVYVQAVEAKRPILTHNARKSMNPASVMKLVTTNAALDLLTPTYRWKTEVYRDGNVANGVLTGNLIIKGYGDPNFKAADFWRMLMSLQQSGIKTISGDLIIDKSYFANNVDGAGTFDDEVWRAYNAKPSAFLVNGRNTSFKFTVGEAGVNVQQEFELPEIQIINNMTLAETGCAAWRSSLTYNVTTLENGAVVTFGGRFSPSCGEKYLELSVFDDEKYALFTFRKLWKQLGGSFSGGLKVMETPSTAIKILEQASDPLGNVVRDINKWSNNLMARQLLLTIGAENIGAPATAEKGEAAVKAWLEGKGLRSDELVIENGSGLSRLERINAAQLGKMLVSTFHEATMPEFMASMPILSKDGTVARRLKNGHASGRVHLKTGSINGVSAIAGYVLDANNHRHVLVMLVNHANAGNSRAAQDAMIEWVHQQP